MSKPFLRESGNLRNIIFELFLTLTMQTPITGLRNKQLTSIIMWSLKKDCNQLKFAYCASKWFSCWKLQENCDQKSDKSLSKKGCTLHYWYHVTGKWTWVRLWKKCHCILAWFKPQIYSTRRLMPQLERFKSFNLNNLINPKILNLNLQRE